MYKNNLLNLNLFFIFSFLLFFSLISFFYILNQSQLTIRFPKYFMFSCTLNHEPLTPWDVSHSFSHVCPPNSMYKQTFIS